MGEETQHQPHENSKTLAKTFLKKLLSKFQNNSLNKEPISIFRILVSRWILKPYTNTFKLKFFIVKGFIIQGRTNFNPKKITRNWSLCLTNHTIKGANFNLLKKEIKLRGVGYFNPTKHL